MTGYDYEHAVAAYLLRNGFHDVEVTQASGDYGVDIVAWKDSLKYAVQCKYYTSPVGVSAIQEVVAGKSMYGCSVAMVVTNNDFTPSAEELARANSVILVPRIVEQPAIPKVPEIQHSRPHRIFRRGFIRRTFRQSLVPPELSVKSIAFWLIHTSFSVAALMEWSSSCKAAPSISNYLSVIFILAFIAYPIWIPMFWRWICKSLRNFLELVRDKIHTVKFRIRFKIRKKLRELKKK